MDVFLNIGSQRLTVSVYSITRSISQTLNSKLDDAIMKTLFKEFPPLANESREAYDARHKVYLESRKEVAKRAKEETDSIPKKGKKAAVAEEPAEEDIPNETLRDYVRKQLQLTKYEDQLDYLFDCVISIAETFNQASKVDVKALDNVPLLEINNFVFKVCKYAKIPIGLSEEKMSYDDFS